MRITSRTTIYYFSLFVLSVFASCSKSEPADSLSNVSKIIVADNGNSGNASDLEINFQKQFDTKNILEYRIFLIKAENLKSFNQEIAEQITDEGYESVLPDNIYPIKGHRLKSTSKDTDGDSINKDLSYHAAVLSVAKDEGLFRNAFEISSNPFQITINNQIELFKTDIEAGAGDITFHRDGTLYLGSFNIITLLGETGKTPEAERNYFSPLFQFEGRSPSLIASPNINTGGMAINSKGTIFLTSLFDEEILQISQDGNIEKFLFDFPSLVSIVPDGILIDDNDIMYVVDIHGKRVIKILPDGQASTFAIVQSEPRGITVDDQGNLYLSHNTEEGYISKITSNGEVSILATVPTHKPADYNITYKSWVGHIHFYDGTLYVAGVNTDQIFAITLDGEVSIFAGSGTRGITEGGVKTAKLNRPFAITVDEGSNTMYVSSCADTSPSHTQASSPANVLKIDLVEVE